VDRVIVYPNELAAETDVLNTNKNALVAMAKLASAILGTSTLLNGLACSPTSPASLSVEVGPGEIYSLQATDATDYSALPADSHQIYKQGILLDKATLSCPAPGTVGFSINYLIQVAFQEADTDADSRKFIDIDTRTEYTLTKNQTRKDTCVVAAKAGVAAATGTQTTPAPDAGYTGAYVVTVANGQTTITSGDISVYSGAPFINDKLQDKITQAQGDARYVQLSGYSNVAFRATLTTDLDFIGTTGATVIFDDVDYDYNSNYDNTTGIFTATQKGIHDIFGGLDVLTPSDPGGAGFAAEIYVNGVATGGKDIRVVGSGDGPSIPIVDSLFLDVGDEVLIKAVSTSSNTVRVQASYKTNLSIKLVREIP
jgi:hypothetical protein